MPLSLKAVRGAEQQGREHSLPIPLGLILALPLGLLLLLSGCVASPFPLRAGIRDG